MNRLLLLASILFIVSPVWAIKSPQTKAEVAELAAITALMAREKSDFPKKMDELNRPLFDASLKIDNDAEISALKQKGDSIVAAHKAVMTEIIQRTVKLYDIQPRQAAYPEDRDKIVGGEFSGQQSSWSPIYAPERPMKIAKLNGKDILLTAPGSYAGITWEDGSVELDDKAFLFSPGYLGAVIFHESVHYAQVTTKGRGDVITRLRAEIEAHSASSSQEAVAVFNLTPQEGKAVENAFMNQMEIFRRNPSAGIGGAQFAAPGSDNDGSASFWAGARGAAALEREAQANNTANAALQEASRVALTREDQERSRREFAARREADRRAYDFLRSVIGLACSNPGQYRYQLENASRPVDLEINTDVLRDLFNQDVGESKSGLGPNSCQETILRRMIATNGPMTTADFLRWAEEYRQAHPSLLHKFTTSVGDFLGALGNLAPSDGGGGGGSADDASSSRSPMTDAEREAGAQRFRDSMDRQNRELEETARRVHVSSCGKDCDWDGAKAH